MFLAPITDRIRCAGDAARLDEIPGDSRRPSMSSKQSRSAIVAIACALVASSAHNAVARPAAIDPCTLLTADQVKAVLGVEIAVGPPPGKSSCMWKSTGTKVQMVTVSLQAPGTSWEHMKTVLPTVPIKPLSGVGDDAFYQSFGTFVPLAVKKGGTIFIVKIYGVAAPDKQEAYEKALALDVISSGKL
jgi:hypothetical protein